MKTNIKVDYNGLSKGFINLCKETGNEGVLAFGMIPSEILEMFKTHIIEDLKIDVLIKEELKIYEEIEKKLIKAVYKNAVMVV